ncbi:MAG: hypothetical protein COT84_03505 [Chlamydiae bacterium CG10_big_fil_rev_8_21_14_0_10_35_9]|nr:MAG: hypothetical protein COT84_03505 [Chlamydiae bacterium CG10_big_fil_rev_8_21_14_0_10_35_9]
MNFQELIQFISLQFHIDLRSDSHESCSIKIDDKIIIQLEMDTANERLIIMTYITEIAPGRFRENILVEALKANHLPTRIGTLGFLPETGELTFHHFFSSQTTKYDLISQYLTEMIYVCMQWKDAIDTGKAGPEGRQSSNKNTNPFGLKP